MSLVLFSCVQVARAATEQALSWAENDDTGATKGGLKIIVVENMFQPSDFEVGVRLMWLGWLLLLLTIRLDPRP